MDIFTIYTYIFLSPSISIICSAFHFSFLLLPFNSFISFCVRFCLLSLSLEFLSLPIMFFSAQITISSNEGIVFNFGTLSFSMIHARKVILTHTCPLSSSLLLPRFLRSLIEMNPSTSSVAPKGGPLFFNIPDNLQKAPFTGSWKWIFSFHFKGFLKPALPACCWRRKSSWLFVLKGWTKLTAHQPPTRLRMAWLVEARIRQGRCSVSHAPERQGRFGKLGEFWTGKCIETISTYYFIYVHIYKT